MITINLDRAKTISHAIRRQKRAAEFEPLDQVIMRQIPGTDVQAVEAQRQTIRDRYADLQTQIDATDSVDTLTTIVRSMS
jgi:hypothetical protein